MGAKRNPSWKKVSTIHYVGKELELITAKKISQAVPKTRPTSTKSAAQNPNSSHWERPLGALVFDRPHCQITTSSFPPSQDFCHPLSMEYDNEKIDQAALALLFVNSWQEGPDKDTRSWKSLDWDIGDRLHKQGLITDPVGKANP